MTCCSAPSWAAQMWRLWPFADETALVDAGTELADQLDWPDVLKALSAHPRIGERLSRDDREARWSQQEQAGLAENFRRSLVAGNIAYERRFGHVFLICATGLTGEEMHSELTKRLANDISAERLVVRRELSKIVGLRLRKLLAS
ncbi:MAG TPA: 2-oxo-4-hydroxy-4-carboxy-5-ureidoimidazoline decarboxylase [Micromonosporaceae bacterium]|nr:2-oxo-4-hydroxy-4-carboxy-5-ureidoimidazoline decarboxylase [Micromonosporaceae bacterium]